MSKNAMVKFAGWRPEGNVFKNENSALDCDLTEHRPFLFFCAYVLPYTRRSLANTTEHLNRR